MTRDIDCKDNGNLLGVPSSPSVLPRFSKKSGLSAVEGQGERHPFPVRFLSLLPSDSSWPISRLQASLTEPSWELKCTRWGKVVEISSEAPPQWSYCAVLDVDSAPPAYVNIPGSPRCRNELGEKIKFPKANRQTYNKMTISMTSRGEQTNNKLRCWSCTVVPGF